MEKLRACLLGLENEEYIEASLKTSKNIFDAIEKIHELKDKFSIKEMKEQNKISIEKIKNEKIKQKQKDEKKLIENMKEYLKNKIKNNKSCLKCKENEADILLLPCRHVVVCKNCKIKLYECPLCKNRYKGSKQIFKSY